jgi:hypothetical protein
MEVTHFLQLINLHDELTSYSAEGEHVVFEAFEASPRSEDVLAAEGALECDFPGSSVSIPLTTYMEPNFQLNLARFLEQASREPVSSFAPLTGKSGQYVVEERQTAHPDLITNYFITLLEAFGRHAHEVPHFHKRIRDNACWKNGAKFPFRRLPLWLVLRIGLRRHLHLLFGDESGQAHYKFLIASVLSDLLADILRRGGFDHHKMAFINAKLSRRLSKLEDDRTNASALLQGTYEKMFDMLGPKFLHIMSDASRSVDVPYEKFKLSVLRIIYRLPWKMVGPKLHGQDPFLLTLSSSGQYLGSIPTGPAFWQLQQIGLTNEPIHCE